MFGVMQSHWLGKIVIVLMAICTCGFIRLCQVTVYEAEDPCYKIRNTESGLYVVGLDEAYRDNIAAQIIRARMDCFNVYEIKWAEKTLEGPWA